VTDRKPDHLYCRFCNYSVLKFRTTAQGRTVQGWATLKDHIELEHPADFERIYGEPILQPGDLQ
jgi:hypothetical protein